MKEKGKYMYCEKCGKQVEDNVKFCPYCGASLQKNRQKTTDSVIRKSGHQNRKLIPVIVLAIILVGGFLIHNASGNGGSATMEKDNAWADQVVQAEWYKIDADDGSGLRFLKNDDGEVTVSLWLNSMRMTDFMPCTENDTMKTLTIPENDRQSDLTGFTYVQKDDSFYLVAHYEDGDSAKCEPTDFMYFAQ